MIKLSDFSPGVLFTYNDAVLQGMILEVIKIENYLIHFKNSIGSTAWVIFNKDSKKLFRIMNPLCFRLELIRNRNV